MERRPLKSREKKWAQVLAASIANLGITPNTISVVSVVFSAFSFFAFLEQQYILAAVFIQLRLLCNLMDGMVAVEHNKKSIYGDLYNDIPDRLADLLIISGAGYAAHFFPLGLLNSALAIATAYIRTLGAGLGLPHYFLGPQAKPHRMALLTLACILQVVFPQNQIMQYSLWIMFVGLVITLIRRTVRIARELRARAESKGA